MEATRRQRALRAVALMAIGMAGAFALSLDPARAVRSPFFWAMTLGMLAWTVAENLALRQDEPKDYRHKRQTRVMQAAVMLAVFLGVADLFHAPWPHPAWLIPLGLAVLGAGALLRIVAIRTLDRHFSYELRVTDGHRLVRAGPYALLRHPSYLGLLLVTVGAALALGSALAALVGGAVMAGVVVWRIRDEEAMMRAAFGAEYDAYAKESWAFLPGVY